MKKGLLEASFKASRFGGSPDKKDYKEEE